MCVGREEGEGEEGKEGVGDGGPEKGREGRV